MINVNYEFLKDPETDTETASERKWLEAEELDREREQGRGRDEERFSYTEEEETYPEHREHRGHQASWDTRGGNIWQLADQNIIPFLLITVLCFQTLGVVAAAGTTIQACPGTAARTAAAGAGGTA